MVVLPYQDSSQAGETSLNGNRDLLWAGTPLESLSRDFDARKL